MNAIRRGRLFNPTIARVDLQGTIWLVNSPDKGWASFAYPYASLEELQDRWDVRITTFGVDHHSPYYNVLPN